MAFKLCNPYVKTYRLEKFFFSKLSKEFNSRYVHKCKSLEQLRILMKDCHHQSLLLGSHSYSLRNSRFVHVNSTLYGKVIPYNLSDIGEGIVEVVIKEWFVKTGDKINQFDPICEVQSDKASATISSRYDGIVKKLHYEIDATAKVGAPLIDIEVDNGASDLVAEGKADSEISEAKVASKPDQVDEDDRLESSKALATPAVRKLAKENNIDLEKLRGSGKSGRILKEDVLVYIENISQEGQGKSSGSFPAAASVSEDVVEEITGIRKHMVKTMKTAWDIPHFSYCDEVDSTELVNMKENLRRLSQSKGIKITFMPFFIKAASLALSKYPIINSTPDENCERITIKSSHNIGVAIDTPHGLIVPNIKNVQKLDIFDVARELNRLQSIAAKGQLGVNDLSGGTFTLSNIGIIGGTYTKPIIMPPQVVIGGIGKIQVLPRFDKNKNIVEAHIFNISWAADHRVLDGATLARFSNLWKLYVENPQLLLQL